MLERLRVAVVTPLWNEERTLIGLARSIEAQTMRPVAWVLVDDGSTDRTDGIAREIADRSDFVYVVTRPRRAIYGADSGAPAAAFNAGIAWLSAFGEEYDVVMKIDGDLVLDRRFIEAISDAFASDATLGIASGGMYFSTPRGTILDKPGGNHTRGATKAYRRECLAAIGGVTPRLGWDTIDEITAQLRGFRVATIGDAKATQLRLMGATTGIYRGRVRAGRAAYLLGYSAWAISLRALRRLAEPPRIAGSLCLLYGYAKARFRCEPLTASPEVVQFLRMSHRQRLWGLVSGPLGRRGSNS